MGLFNKENTVVGKPKNNKTNNIKIKSLSGYDAIRENLDKENNTLTVKQSMLNKRPKTKVSIGLN